jgi:hypothetical protein
MGRDVGIGERRGFGLVGCEHPIIRTKKISEIARSRGIFIM